MKFSNIFTFLGFLFLAVAIFTIGYQFSAKVNKRICDNSISVANMPENNGRYIIKSGGLGTKYYYVSRLSEEKFGILWHKGYEFSLLPQKFFDSSGKGQKILDKETGE